mgnify:CR=1 FL=1
MTSSWKQCLPVGSFWRSRSGQFVVDAKDTFFFIYASSEGAWLSRSSFGRWRFSHGSSSRMIAAKTTMMIVRPMKKELCETDSHTGPPAIPESLLPIAMQRKKPPIMTATSRGGASLLTSERPIGLRQSSPMVIQK